MATIKVFNNDENRMETYYRAENESMPYINGNTLLVREFRGSSRSDLLWTEKRAMQSWNSFRFMYGRPIHIGFAFKRPFEGGHGQQSQHYAGLAFDVGQNLTNSQRTEMRNLAYNSGLWTYVEPVSLSPTWVVALKRDETVSHWNDYMVVGTKGVEAHINNYLSTCNRALEKTNTAQR
ncbi:MAG: hypothetical protein FWC62_00655 [Firmicutes bacterium]|nr:hypothetical protein [Bacillota bacterium]